MEYIDEYGYLTNLELAARDTDTTEPLGTRMGRSEGGQLQSAVIRIQSILGKSMGPPAEKLYPVLPVAVLMIIPSP